MPRIWLINQYASTPDTGIGGRPHHLARELSLLGHVVTVIAARWHHLLNDPDAADAKPEVELVEGYRFLRIDAPRYRHAHDRRRTLAWFAFAWALRHAPRILGERPDVIVASSPSLISYLGAERLARRMGARLVFEVRDIWPLTLVEVGGMSPRSPFLRFLQWIEDRAYRNADAVISNWPLAVEHMVERGMDRRKFTWIPNGFSRAETKTAEPAELAVPAGAFVVGYAGTHGLANALDTLLDAAAILRAHEDIWFAFIGGGQMWEALRDRARNAGLDRVVFTGRVAKRKVPSLLRRFDVCYVGAKDSPLYRFGSSYNKLFDYLAAGRPVIYALHSGDYHPVLDAGAGLETPPQDPAALADAILELKALPEAERARMGERGRDFAYERHEYGAIARRLERVLVSAS